MVCDFLSPANGRAKVPLHVLLRWHFYHITTQWRHDVSSGYTLGVYVIDALDITLWPNVMPERVGGLWLYDGSRFRGTRQGIYRSD